MLSWLVAGLLSLTPAASAAGCQIPWDPTPFTAKHYQIGDTTDGLKEQLIAKFRAQFPEKHPDHIYLIMGQQGLIMIVVVEHNCVVGVARPGTES